MTTLKKVLLVPHIMSHVLYSSRWYCYNLHNVTDLLLPVFLSTSEGNVFSLLYIQRGMRDTPWFLVLASFWRGYSLVSGPFLGERAGGPLDSTGVLPRQDTIILSTPLRHRTGGTSYRTGGLSSPLPTTPQSMQFSP